MSSRDRDELQYILEDILGSTEVYFQPPATLKMHYPAIVYSLTDIDDFKADNIRYVHHKAYMVTVIDKDPDSVIADKVSDLELCKFDRAYASDHLNHFVFRIFY